MSKLGRRYLSRGLDRPRNFPIDLISSKYYNFVPPRKTPLLQTLDLRDNLCTGLYQSFVKIVRIHPASLIHRLPCYWAYRGENTPAHDSTDNT